MFLVREHGILLVTARGRRGQEGSACETERTRRANYFNLSIEDQSEALRKNYGMTSNRNKVYRSLSLSSILIHKEDCMQVIQQHKKRSIGIDCGKRTYEACVLTEEKKIVRFSGKTNIEGREELKTLIHKEDEVGIEAGIPAFGIARFLEEHVGCKVHILNPGDLRMIYLSMKKTDKEDALKLAQVIKYFPEEDLPKVTPPTREEELDRELLSLRSFLKKQRTACINRLHAVYMREGIMELKKTDLRTVSIREKTQQRLENSQRKVEAVYIEELLLSLEKQIAEIDQQIHSRLKAQEASKILLSIPGVGPCLTMAFLSYIGDGSRFSHARQVSYYTGLVPRVDSSGDTTKVGGITKRGCTIIRSYAVQAAWSLVRSKANNPLKEKYFELSQRRGKGRAIVAVARKLVEIMYILLVRNMYYKWATEQERIIKWKRYNLC